MFASVKMSDLAVPPSHSLTSSSKVSSNTLSATGKKFTSATEARAYSMCDVSDVQDPTFAWVQSLPSPNNDDLFYSELLSRPKSRFLETPRPNLEVEPNMVNAGLPDNSNSCSKVNNTPRTKRLQESNLQRMQRSNTGETAQSVPANLKGE